MIASSADDEREFVRTLSGRRQPGNIESTAPYDAEEEIVKVENDSPGFILLDRNMPGTDGLAVVRRVEIGHPRIQTIILTGHGSNAEERLPLQRRAFALLHKPVDVNVLIEPTQAAHGRTTGTVKVGT